MCNRYRMTAKQADLAARYDVDPIYPEDVTFPPPELFPKTPAWIVRNDVGARMLDVMRWGVPTKVPGNKIDKVTGKPMMLARDVTNVRNLASPFWRSMLTNPAQRCLVPFTAFSEYGQQRGADGKLPLHWFEVPSQPIVSLAGIWRRTEAGPRFAFLTTAPNLLVEPIHPKAMPVLLHQEDEQRWLMADWLDAQQLVAPYPSQLMSQSQEGGTLDRTTA